jgi:hypothetical protein
LRIVLVTWKIYNFHILLKTWKFSTFSGPLWIMQFFIFFWKHSGALWDGKMFSKWPIYCEYYKNNHCAPISQKAHQFQTLRSASTQFPKNSTKNSIFFLTQNLNIEWKRYVPKKIGHYFREWQINQWVWL